ncbi:MAG TPA: hypothetical protein VFI55_04945 [Mycobacterium sp.]|nr:hypothetical protein [Mycobacterium sp.]
MPFASGAMPAGQTIVRLPGYGGMGDVYFAQHPRSLRSQALKILRTDISAHDAYRRRLVREADVPGSLGTDAATMQRDRYPVGASANQVAAVVAAIPSAVDYAHRRRDKSPTRASVQAALAPQATTREA